MKLHTLLSFLLTAFFIPSFSYAKEEVSKLQTTGIFIKNEKGTLVFTDDEDKIKYYAFNKGTKEKVGELIDQKVKLLAKVKKKVGAKITLMTYIISIKPVQ
ncbi:hypothetical protein N9J83_00225 [Opitutales bacterium]|nr:hypothetical protein [Opitutales bacterium]